ncbi:DUF1569 domain-containing protein [Edaphobacter modestus]|uniref:DinB family protein n=1 Tax=Edaphobacter modestus TaxID=388466 RepID=A0A4V2G437_9BACT|nr:DUF1569 domain-containing protein [Edaphobacter modestus]RZU39416.1 DinB family protein [Edaphobacter modestus]
MNPTLRRLEDEFSRSLRGLTAPQTQLHPHRNPARWNICQITQHLLLTYSSTTSAIEARMAKGTPTRSRATLSQLIAQLFVIRLGLLPSRREAPPAVTPSANPAHPHPDGDALISAFSTALATMEELLERAEGHFTSTPCLSHFALGPLNIAQWRRFHLVHGRHHIRQITAIRREYRL